MGTFQVTVEMGDAQGLRSERMEALVDADATYLGGPRNVLAALGCRPLERWPFALANDRIVEREVGVESLRPDGRTFPVLRVFGDEGSEPLLGAVALESSLLAADPVNGRLAPVVGKLKRLPHIHRRNLHCSTSRSDRYA